MKIRNPVIDDPGKRQELRSHLAGGIRYPGAGH